ncbi:neurofilament heavy polypeptide [Drosophila sulfurigaster albostrigata]|uniref:neurofilament heavy polypeptide n=1 Tax=Drosophila sulfurigaster albostrigata TaxID=89887 RepID=UPI002D21CCF0|nr:neurofilament heavy polypeptide [Drosophila sulfurigaster albostrigata]
MLMSKLRLLLRRRPTSGKLPKLVVLRASAAAKQSERQTKKAKLQQEEEQATEAADEDNAEDKEKEEIEVPTAELVPSAKKQSSATKAASKVADATLEIEAEEAVKAATVIEEKEEIEEPTVELVPSAKKQSNATTAASKDATLEIEAEVVVKAANVIEVEEEETAAIVPEVEWKKKPEAVTEAVLETFPEDEGTDEVAGEEKASTALEAAETLTVHTAEVIVMPSTVHEVCLDQSLEVLPAGVTAEVMNDLGLSPLKKQDEVVKRDDDDVEEMPSLIVLDDEDPAEEQNRTFEIEESPEKQPDELPHSQFLDIEMPTLQMSPEVGIKVVLTDENDENTTILKPMGTPKSSKSKAYKFPTPFKSTSKMNLNFTDVKSTIKKKILNADASRSSRRSKSVCDLTHEQTKTVSFYSPIEVSTVSDIDKRWEEANFSHVTRRRKRSKSVDAPINNSKIPLPKFYGVTKAPSPMPVKLKARTKLPNFAAIHQKHFSKMESLVDHIERKAVRAKELTSSAKKLIPGNSSAKKLPTNSSKLTSEEARPKAIKNIGTLMTPMKPEEAERKRKLPTPRNIMVVQPQQVVTSSRLPLLTKPAATKPKIITKAATSVVPSSAAKKPAMAASAIVKNKLEERRKRHMEMFKGRTTKENRSDLIRGVRSNRRFELQMEHRRQMNENKS